MTMPRRPVRNRNRSPFFFLKGGLLALSLAVTTGGGGGFANALFFSLPSLAQFQKATGMDVWDNVLKMFFLDGMAGLDGRRRIGLETGWQSDSVDSALEAHALAMEELEIAGKSRAPPLVEPARLRPGEDLPWKKDIPIVSMEGRTRVRGEQLWYKIFAREEGHLTNLYASGSLLPVVVLHGGPGIPHDYLEPLESLAKAGRPVIFYDQFGCGFSSLPTDVGFYGVNNMRDDLYSLLTHIRDIHSLEGFHLLGQSWGGCLAMEAVMGGGMPKGVELVSVVVSGTPGNISRVESAVEAKIQRLQEVEGVSPEEAYKAFQKLHWCSLDPWPECLERAYSKAGSVFRGVKAVSSWAVEENTLAEGYPYKTPFLSIRGENDFVTDECVTPLLEGVPGARAAVMIGCSHMAHLEQPDLFCSQVNNFMAEAEGARRMLSR